MQQAHYIIKKFDKLSVGFTIDGLLVGWFNHFEQPRRELIANGCVNEHQRIRNAEFTKMVVHFDNGFVQLRSKPFNGQF